MINWIRLSKILPFNKEFGWKFFALPMKPLIDLFYEHAKITLIKKARNAIEYRLWMVSRLLLKICRDSGD